MNNKKILTMQDISCYGQCSITVALPVLSAFGYETAILPSAILSTHTAGFKNFIVHDLSDEIPNFINHWKNEGIKFDVIYSGYLGENRHIDQLLDIKNHLLNKDGLFIVDPVMGDNGKLYPVFNNDYVEAIKRLIKVADIVIPNLTEACFLTGSEYKESYDEAYIKDIMSKLLFLGAKTVILTGVSYISGKIGVASLDKTGYKYYEHEKISKSYHGTGDLYSSSFIGSYLNSGDTYKAMKIAADFVCECIKNTIDDASHPYGVKFESVLSSYVVRNK